MSEKRVVRVDLLSDQVKDEFVLDAHKKDWIEFDVSDWTLWHYRVIPNTDLNDNIELYVEVYATAWNITGKNGKKIKFPGQAADPAGWLDAYEKMPVTISQHISVAPVTAVYLASRPDKKSNGESNGGGS